MAYVPLSGTNIRLLKGVPFHSDYKHTRWFDNKTQQTSYFLSKTVVHNMTQANFQKIEGKNFIAVDNNIDDLWGVNYVMFQNAQYSSKWFYAFVTRLEYSNKSMTKVYFEIDVFQTWKFEMTFKPSFVVREHCKLWNSDGTPVINTIDEGLNYGLEYDTVYQRKYVPMGQWFKWMVIISKTKLHGSEVNEIEPTIIGTPQPLSYYIIPFRDNFDTGKGLYIKPYTGEDIPISSPLTIIKQLFTNDRVVNNIVSIYATDHIGVDCEEIIGGTEYSDGVRILSNNLVLERVEIPKEDGIITVPYVKRISQFEPTRWVENNNKYNGFRNVKESKLLMYPYSLTVLDDFKGNRIDIKNEYIEGKPLEIITQGSMGTSNKVSYSIGNYLNEFDNTVDRYISLEHGLINNSPNDLSVLNEYLASYLQGNRNSIQNQRTQSISNGIFGVLGSLTSIANAPSVGGVIGAGVGAVKGVADTVIQLQGIEAKQQDAGNIPPQIAKMGGNTAFEFGNKYNGVWVLKKQLKPEYQKKLEDFFNMFGYKINEVKIPNFHTRRYWNYVQTKSCIITGDFNNEDLQEIKNVFDNGIVFWHTDDIGNYSLNNEVL